MRRRRSPNQKRNLAILCSSIAIFAFAVFFSFATDPLEDEGFSGEYVQSKVLKGGEIQKLTSRCEIFIPVCEPENPSESLQRWIDKMEPYIGKKPFNDRYRKAAQNRLVCETRAEYYFKKCGSPQSNKPFTAQFIQNGKRFPLVQAGGWNVVVRGAGGNDQDPVCVDMDGGMNVFVASGGFDNIKYFQNNPVQDACHPTKENVLREVICRADGYVDNPEVECEHGCENGACLRNNSAQLTPSIIPIGDQTATIGEEDVFVLEVELEADGSSDVTIDGLQTLLFVDGANPGDSPTSWFTEARLYMGSIAPENLIDIESASSFGGFFLDAKGSVAPVDFDDFEMSILANQTQKLQVVVGISDNAQISGDTFFAELGGVSAKDEDGNNIDVPPAVGSSSNITIAGIGELSYEGDLYEPGADIARNVISGRLSEYVASFEFNVRNENVLIEDLIIQVNESSTYDGAFDTSVEAVFLYDANGVLIDSEVVGGNVVGTQGQDVVQFDDVNLVVLEGSKNIFVKVQARKFGKNRPGRQTGLMNLELLVDEAEGMSSGEDLTGFVSTGGANCPGSCMPSTNPFSVVPVDIANIAFVSSYGGVQVANEIIAGTENVLAIIAITADTWDSTDQVTGEQLKLAIDELQIEKRGEIAVRDVTIQKINGAPGFAPELAFDYLSSGTKQAFFNFEGLPREDQLIALGQTSYFQIAGIPFEDIRIGDGISINLVDLHRDGIRYGSNNMGQFSPQRLYLDVSEIDGLQIFANNDFPGGFEQELSCNVDVTLTENEFSLGWSANADEVFWSIARDPRVFEAQLMVDTTNRTARVVTQVFSDEQSTACQSNQFSLPEGVGSCLDFEVHECNNGLSFQITCDSLSDGDIRIAFDGCNN